MPRDRAAGRPGRVVSRYDVIVIGAGPAGLAAATAASAAGRDVLLLDSAPAPGGQYWRHRPGDDGRHHRDWTVFQKLLGGLTRVDYQPGTQVWFIQPGFTVHAPDRSFDGARIVLATGAYDRAIPFPGWDLPGVVTPGAAQALLKGQGVAMGRRVVVAGTGPFLLPVAVGLAESGVRVAGVFEANDPMRYGRHPSALRKLGEALGYAARFARHRIPYRTRHPVVAAHGPDRVEAVTVGSREIACDVLAVGYGFTPQLELALTLGCATTLDSDGSIVVQEVEQRTSIPDVFVAGEVTGVGGAQLALVEGRLAGLAAAGLSAPKALLRRRAALRRFASGLAAVHGVPAAMLGRPASSGPEAGSGLAAGCPDETVVCRCEAVTAGAIRTAVADLGVVDARGTKLMARPGMGWCQGRVCGYATAHLTTAALGRPVTAADLLAFAHRPIASPVTLGDLASGLPPAK